MAHDGSVVYLLQVTLDLGNHPILYCLFNMQILIPIIVAQLKPLIVSHSASQEGT